MKLKKVIIKLEKSNNLDGIHTELEKLNKT